MMIKYKVSDVAKDFNVPAKEIIAVFQEAQQEYNEISISVIEDTD